MYHKHIRPAESQPHGGEDIAAMLFDSAEVDTMSNMEKKPAEKKEKTLEESIREFVSPVCRYPKDVIHVDYSQPISGTRP